MTSSKGHVGRLVGKDRDSYLPETFSFKLGPLLLFLSLVLPFIKLQNISPVNHLTSCLLFIEVDKGAMSIPVFC